jgi:7-keto-8-aminopelargonate synthetase-like enzyme
MCRIEDLGKKRKNVAYFADGAYSMRGLADIDSLLYLKAGYGLFLYLDNCHDLSAFGDHCFIQS